MHRTKNIISWQHNTFQNLDDLLCCRALLQSTPIRGKTNKWSTDVKDYPLNKYPYYLRGSAYLFTGDVIPGEPYLDIEKESKDMTVQHFQQVQMNFFLGGGGDFESDQTLGGTTVHASQGPFFYFISVT